MRIPLDFAATREFACQRYGDTVRPSGRSFTEHADEVADVAFRLGSKYYRGLSDPDIDSFPADQVPDEVWDAVFVPASTTEILHWMKHAGMMIGVMSRFGSVFEEVCDMTNSSVAMMLSDVSPDPRVAPPRRMMEFCTRISEAAITSQLLSLAEKLCVASEYNAWLDKSLKSRRISYQKVFDTHELISAEVPRHLEELNALSKIPRQGYIHSWWSKAVAVFQGLEPKSRKLLRNNASRRPPRFNACHNENNSTNLSIS